MKEEEITLLEIDACSRLPYGFKATDGNTVYDVLLKQETVPSVSIEGLLASEGKIKPILYPLSSITEEIFVNGSEICPMKYLAEAFDFDGYMGLYTTWNFDEERECVEFFAWGCRASLLHRKKESIIALNWAFVISSKSFTCCISVTSTTAT